MENSIYDVLILGGGPSGLTAAVYTSRANLKTCVLAGNPPGGQLMLTTEVENFPGFPEGLLGPELIQKMREQVLKFGTEVFDDNAISIEGDFSSGFITKTESGAKYSSRTVIVATGATAKWLDIPSEQRLRGKGVSACATCDGFFFKDKVVAVVGGGDSAMEESNYLTKFASKVYVIARKEKDQLKASKIMQDRAFANKKIEFIFNSEVAEVLGESFVTGLRLRNVVTQELSSLDVDGLFLAIGHSPNTSFLANFIETDSVGYAKTKNGTRSSVEGVFVAGDVQDHIYRQAITAAGYGCMAALDTERFLASKE
ncbi:thioredoxin-disulfide reductase [Candidatus Nomurabacteria bacterium]|uniref:Thioredoxin reductase n=1 Tax=candidate division WWE3 bacterium TaxID=2053526 RepID=A0A955IW13_UNCKA|nr:thioredoxin-disulfide reductase [candidate division WWE3 bacterium]MCB9823892.1 thioredoxin-disulfide reductase [Candidatus Nomurabacteria bacterium]MCB9827128.1 thioredoxin-disulfide reductase [Candidatus Nomurabacteria bacterium]MCB9827831.1 thioredoxin-disulfide reductase [Candidatus Nomurabacteria bacterium]